MRSLVSLAGLYLIPHGDEIIDLPDESSRVMADKIMQVCSTDVSDSVAIISPHSLSLSKNVSVIMSSYLKVSYRLKTGVLRRTYESDRALSESILRLDPGFTEAASLITSSGPNSIFPMDFGTAIPLRFFGKRKISMMGQPRVQRRDSLVHFGSMLFRAVQGYDQKVSVIISADQAHTHSSSGPYGYSPDAAYYDSLITESVKNSNLSPLLELSEETITRAKPDSYWNMLILHGFLSESGIRTKFDYYYVAGYFGMLLGHGELPRKSQ